jgi:hypothetical protein
MPPDDAAAAGAGGSRQQAPDASPFAAAAAQAAAARSVALTSSSSRYNGPTPLLPLTLSDDISIEAAEGDSSTAAAEGAFNFRLVFQQMLPSADEAPAPPVVQQSSLVSMDTVLALLPRARPVRLYPVTARNNVMWEAVQQAFAFFSSSEGAAAAAAAAAAAGAGAGGALGSSASLSSAASLARQATAPPPAAAGAGGSDGSALPSIQALDLTQPPAAKRLQQQQQHQQHAGAGIIGSSGGSGNAVLQELHHQQQHAALNSLPGSSLSIAAAGGGAGSSRPAQPGSSRLSTDSPSRASLGAATGSQIFSAISSFGGAGRRLQTAGAAGGGNGASLAASGLTDILEIRTDVDCVRLISSPDKPPPVSVGRAQSLPAPTASLCHQPA